MTAAIASAAAATTCPNIFLVTPVGASQCLRQANGFARMWARAQLEFPRGVCSIKPVTIAELDRFQRSGMHIPVAGRRLLGAWLQDHAAAAGAGS